MSIRDEQGDRFEESRYPFDQGLVVFKLDEAAATVLPVPDGFNTVAELDVFLATRKLVARAVRPRSSQLVVYGLADGSLTLVPNPDGVASIGPAQANVAAGAANVARLLAPNAKANTVAGVAYDAEGNQKGIIVVRVP